MNVTNDKPDMDYVDYFTKQLPQDLAQMAALRDELAKRQGALSAVEQANADREKAAGELADAQLESARILSIAKESQAKATAKEKHAVQREKEFELKFAAVKADIEAKQAEQDRKEKELNAKYEDVTLKALAISNREAQLAVEQAAFAVRVKAFQDKVASITA